MTAKAPLALVGPGSAGSALVTALRRSGWPIVGVLARDAASAADAAVRLRVPSLGASGAPAEGLTRAGIVVLAVHDDDLAALSTSLAAGCDWTGRCVLQLSGGLPSSVLSPLAERGASVASFHPLMTFVGPDADSSPALPTDTPFFMEGDAEALQHCTELAAALGVKATEITAEAKALYHCAATMAGNFVTTLLAGAAELLTAAGVDQGAEVFVPLARESAQAVGRRPPGEALTGPIARGDVQTLARHLAAMEEAGLSASTRKLHLVLAEATAELARRAGRIEPLRHAEIARLLSAASLRFTSNREEAPASSPPSEIESRLPGESE